MRKCIALLLCALMLSAGAIGEDASCDFGMFDGMVIPDTLHRIRLPERAADAHMLDVIKLADGAITVSLDADVHDFGVRRAIPYRATAAEIDAKRLIAFCWPGEDAAAILAKGWLDGSLERYLHAGGELRIARDRGTISFFADARREEAVNVLYHPNLSSDLADLPDAPGGIADAEAANGRAREFLALFGIEEAPLLQAAYAQREKYADRTVDTEVFDYAVVRDGLPFCNRPYPANPEVTHMIPAQQLLLGFDAQGLAELRATLFHLEPTGEEAEILFYESIFDNLREGEGFIWFSGEISIASITLEYVLIEGEGGYLCVPAWRFHERPRPWEISWAEAGNVYEYSAWTGEFIT